MSRQATQGLHFHLRQVTRAVIRHLIGYSTVGIIHPDTVNHESQFIGFELIRTMIACVVVNDTDDIQLIDRKLPV